MCLHKQFHPCSTITRPHLTPSSPKIPYIGGKDNIFTSYLIAPVILIPLVRMLKEKGHPLRETGQIMFEIMEMGYNSMPAPVRWATRMGYFGEKRKEKYRQGSARSLKRQYPGDWVYDYVECNGSSFHFGLTIKECGIFNFWKKQGLEEFTPYLCLSDWILWKALGIEVKRTQTIANGGDLCDFFYIRKKKRVPRGWPPETLPEWTGKYEG
jgi:hypothetical protein